MSFLVKTSKSSDDGWGFANTNPVAAVLPPFAVAGCRLDDFRADARPLDFFAMEFAPQVKRRCLGEIRTSVARPKIVSRFTCKRKRISALDDGMMSIPAP